MDVIKTSLIFAIGVTLYYLLLQWPMNEVNENNYSQKSLEISSFNDSEQLLSESLSPLSSPAEIKKTEEEGERNYFEIQNSDVLLLVDSKTGRFDVSQLKNVAKDKGAQEPFLVFGRTVNSETGIENSYFANSGFYTRTQGYLAPEFSKISSPPGLSIWFSLNGRTVSISFLD